MPTRLVMSFSAEAISSAWARLSSAHGPAISANGRSLPKRALPTATTGDLLGVASIAADHGGRGPPGQPWFTQARQMPALRRAQPPGRPPHDPYASYAGPRRPRAPR